MNGFKYNSLKELVDDCRRLGVDIYKSSQVEIRLTAPHRMQLPDAAAPTPADTPPVPRGKPCACGCKPWQCNGIAPCRKGCQYAQCHPDKAPTIEATKAVRRKVS